MNSERWQQVKEVLDGALALAKAEQIAYLEQVCRGDPELLSEVETLLHHHQEAGSGFLHQPAIDLQAPLGDSGSSRSRIGRRIGVFQILEEIGHGGMGEVYRAARVDGQYEKQVAVKLVRGGYDTASVLERFRNERQILASLDHANIARLLDGGTTEDGIPYLVMELIEGTPIDRYCDEHALPVTDRLKLFRSVCSAVQYAHQRLVIHRDIKPGNILVTRDGTPKLLDFGIAKLLDPSSGPETTLARPMTPEYASPEQVRGDPITTASDVYSLGVVLYQLLTGHSPYRARTRSHGELARAITETEPERPSTAVLRPEQPRSNSQPERMAQRAPGTASEGSLARLRRRLAGDLDDIVLMALRKEPQRRYPSVEQFAEDIRRHLDGLPVAATRGSWRYRAQKFVIRHRAGVAAAGVAFLALAVGVGATLREARIARAERVRAEKRFNDVRQLANSLVFEIHDSIQSLPGATPVRKLLLDRAVEYLDKLSQDAGGDINLQRELAWGYKRLAAVQGDTTQSNLGQISAAEATNHKATALFEAVAKANPNNVIDQLNVAMVHRTLGFANIYEPGGRKEIDLAMAITDRLMRTNEANPDVRNERALEYQGLAYALDAAGDRVQSVEAFRKLNTLRQDILRTSPNYPGIRRAAAKSTVLFGFQLAHIGPRVEALQQMQAGLDAYEALVKAGSEPDVIRELATSKMRRGDVQLMQGDSAAAHSSFSQARAAIARLAKLDPENTMLQSDLWSLEYEEGRVLAIAGRYAEALAALQRAFRGFEKLHLEGDTGPGNGPMQIWIGETQAGMHNLPAALEAYQKAVVSLTADLTQYDDARCDLATADTKIGNALFKLGKLLEAADAYTKALDTANLSFAVEHQDIPALYAAADAYAGLGDVYAAQARQTQEPSLRSKLSNSARTSYEKSLNTWKQIPNPSRISPNGYLTRDPHELAQHLNAKTWNQERPVALSSSRLDSPASDRDLLASSCDSLGGKGRFTQSGQCLGGGLR